jgi:hypothetical protein
MQASKKLPQCAATDPRVLDCLTAYLTRNCPAAARAFHLTCRNAATSIKNAVQQLTLVTKHVDLAALSHNFPAVAAVQLHQCRVDAPVRCAWRNVLAAVLRP